MNISPGKVLGVCYFDSSYVYRCRIKSELKIDLEIFKDAYKQMEAISPSSGIWDFIMNFLMAFLY